MATDARVKELMAEELEARAPEAFAEAGTNWPKKTMGVFFPQDENTVDLCALAVLDEALAEDGTSITKKARDSVAILIKTGTKASDAVKIIALTTLKPTPTP
jgi:hypothetical protein